MRSGLSMHRHLENKSGELTTKGRASRPPESLSAILLVVVLFPLFMSCTRTSVLFVLRFFYFAFACLLYSMWRAVDFLVQIELTGEYDRSPVVTANTVLTLLKQTGIG